MIDPSGMVEIPTDKVREAVQFAYSRSVPQGLGISHYQAGDLDEEAIDAIIGRASGFIVVDMDYVRGRSCKFSVFSDQREPARYFVHPRWYDHTEADLVDLLEHIGVEEPQAKIDAAIGRSGGQL